MSDAFYRLVRLIGSFPLWVSSSPLVVGAENIPREGPFILGATHQSAFDVPLLIRHSPRPLDFVSVVEAFRNPVLGWFYGSLGAFAIDRSRPDQRGVRTILARLEGGRAVALFPEGRIRAGADSVVRGGAIRPGVGRLARLARVPVIPCALFNSQAYRRAASWLPHRRVRYGVMFGPALAPALEAAELDARLARALSSMHAELAARLEEG